MYISKFRIQNFKSFDDVTFHFHEKVNILTGVNNSGKTSVLEALALWHEMYVLLLQQAGNTVAGKYSKGQYVLGTTEHIYVAYSNIVSIKSPRYADIFRNLDIDTPLHLIATLKNEDKELEIAFYLGKSEGLQNYKIGLLNYDNFDFQLFNDLDFIGNPRTALKTIFSIPVGTLIPKEEIKRWQALQRYVLTRDSREILRNRIFDLKSRFNDQYGHFIASLQKILIGSPRTIDLSVIEDQDFWVEIDIRTPRQIEMNLALMGSGTIQIIEILLAIYEQSLGTNIILLDEPDSHLHRQLQKRLLDLLGERKSEDASKEREAERGRSKTQVFMTTHNESLIREANHEWLFHLEQQSVKEYFSVRQHLSTKKGLLKSGKSPIIQTLNDGNGLDFINALEADTLFLVEGEDDALRIQKLLINDPKKYAFWLMRGVDNIFGQIGIMKDIFTQIKNNKTLWEKSILIFDKDNMTEQHRERLIENFNNKLKIKTHIWESYNFESVLLSDIDKFTRLLHKYIETKNKNINFQDLQTALHNEIEAVIAQKKILIQDSTLFNERRGNLQARRKKLADKDLKIEFKDIIEDDSFLQKNVEKYWLDACNADNFHKIMDKNDFETILQGVLQPLELNFRVVEDSLSNFDELFAELTNATMPRAYNEIYNLTR